MIRFLLIDKSNNDNNVIFRTESFKLLIEYINYSKIEDYQIEENIGFGDTMVLAIVLERNLLFYSPQFYSYCKEYNKLH